MTPWLVEERFGGSSEVDSAALFARASFFRSAYASQMRPPRRTWLADLSKWSFYYWTEWLATLADPESKATRTFGLCPEAVEEAMLRWLLMADLMERMKIYQAATRPVISTIGCWNCGRRTTWRSIALGSSTSDMATMRAPPGPSTGCSICRRQIQKCACA